VLYFALGRGEVRVAAVAGGDDRPITQATSNAIYSAGRLLFLREGTLLAQPFDVDALTLSGSPVAVASDVAMVDSNRGVFSASDAGSVLYQQGTRDAALTLAWFDPEGRRVSTLGEVGNARGVFLSPDARVTTLSITDAQLRGDLWRVDTATGQRTRLTSEVPPNDVNPFVAWAPDGRSIVYSARRQDRLTLVRRQMSGSGGEAPVFDVAVSGADRDQSTFDLPRVTAWSRDGSLLTYSYRGLFVVPMGGAARDVKAFGSDEGRGQNPRLSPDGRWVSYQARREGGGVLGVFVDAFPGGGRRQQLAEEGTLAVWGPDGRSFYYLTKNTLVRTDVREADGQLVFSPPRAIMSVRQGRGYSYDVAPDGRILALVTPEEQASRPLTLVQNGLAATADR
jgi:Tol biopolymer transport system component